MSYNRNGKPIPAEHKPKRIFDMLFVKDGPDAAQRLALSQSALDELMQDARLPLVIQARPRNSFRVPTVCKRYRDKNREIQTVAQHSAA